MATRGGIKIKEKNKKDIGLYNHFDSDIKESIRKEITKYRKGKENVLELMEDKELLLFPDYFYTYYVDKKIPSVGRLFQKELNTPENYEEIKTHEEYVKKAIIN